jgi:hypothetical protein
MATEARDEHPRGHDVLGCYIKGVLLLGLRIEGLSHSRVYVCPTTD